MGPHLSQCSFQPSRAKQRPGRLSSCVLSVLCSSSNSGQEGTFESCPMVCLWGYWIIFLTRTPVSCSVSLRYGWKKWFLILTFLLPWVMYKILSRSFWSPGQKGRNVLIQELDPTLITFLELPETDKYKMWDMTFSQPAQIVFFDQTCKSEIFIYMSVDFDPSCDMPLLSHQTPISCSNLMSPCSSSIVLLEGWHPPPKTLKVGGC